MASRQNRKSNAAHYKAYDKARANRPDRVAARQAYAQTERGRERINAGSYAWRERNPEKYKAHTTVNNAIRSGKLQRQGCEVCGEKAHAHHDDYDRPLDVRWLCHAHHREHHAREG